jgi:hypothetical protein
VQEALLGPFRPRLLRVVVSVIGRARVLSARQKMTRCGSGVCNAAAETMLNFAMCNEQSWSTGLVGDLPALIVVANGTQPLTGVEKRPQLCGHGWGLIRMSLHRAPGGRGVGGAPGICNFRAPHFSRLYKTAHSETDRG